MSSTDTVWVPSAMESPTLVGSIVPIPRRSAVSAIADGPSASAIWAYTVLDDTRVASMTLMRPWASPP